MKVWPIMLAVAVAGLGSSSGRSQVNSCDPSAFANFAIQSTDLRTNIIYAEKLNQKQSGSESSSAGIDILGYVGLNESQQKEYLDALSKIVDLNISSDDKRFLLVSEMDAEGRKAYEDCIAGRSFYIIPPDGSMLGNEFTTQVHLSASLMKGLAPLELTLTGGQFSAFPTTFKANKNNTHLFGKIGQNGTEPVTIIRNLDVPLNFTATVGNGFASDYITLPGQPTIIREEGRFSIDGSGNVVEFRDACDQCATTGHSARLCVSVPDSEVVIPGTAVYQTYQSGPGARLIPTAGWTEQTDKQAQYFHRISAHQVCLDASTDVQSVQSNWCGVGYLSARVYVAVPREQASSGQPQQPNQPLSCQRPRG